MEKISSRKNPLCVHLRHLASSASYRREQREYLCDSPKLLQEALQWGAEITAIAYTSHIDMARLYAEYQANFPARLVLVTESVMEAISPASTPQGVVFSCRMREYNFPECLADSRYILLEGIQDPGNVGTILRSADAFDWTVALLPGCADLYHPRTLRAAMGAHFRRPVLRGTLADFTEKAGQIALPLYAAALDSTARPVQEIDFRRCAVLIGSEGQGISQEARSLCSGFLRIPMRESCESLNAAAAAAILLWEGYRISNSGIC